MPGEPFHVGCGLRCQRVTDLRSALYAPGVWSTPAVWRRPDLLKFSCPEHGLVDWWDTRYGAAHARPAEQQQLLVVA